MKFEANRKTLASSVSIISKMYAALSLGGAGDDVFLIAKDGKLNIRALQGTLVVDVVVEGVKVLADGIAKVDPGQLAGAVNLKGETFSATLTKKKLDFSCGRTKAHIGLTGIADELACKIPDDLPKPTLKVRSLRDLVNAINLKMAGEDQTPDRTFHFTKDSVQAEASDTWRAAISTSVYLDSSVTEESSISLSPKCLAAIEPYLENAIIGFDSEVFVIKKPNLFCSFPQATTPPIEMLGQIEEWLGQQEMLAEATLIRNDLQSALDDIIKLTSNKANSPVVSIRLTKAGGIVKGSAESTEAQTEFDLVTTSEEVEFEIAPGSFREILAFYKGSPHIVLKVYSFGVTFHLPSNLDDYLTTQMTSCPLTSETVVLSKKADDKAKKVKAKEPEEEAGEEEAGEEEAKEEKVVAAPKKKAKAKPAPEPEPEPDEAEEEEAPAPTPKKKEKPAPEPEEAAVEEAPKKKVTKKAPEPEPEDDEDEDDEDDEEEEDEEDEEFDEDE